MTSTHNRPKITAKKLPLTPPKRTFSAWFARPLVQWAIAVLFFFSISFYYMGSAITSCSVASPAVIGDSTGGLAWDQANSGNGLSWSYSKVSNYPYGEPIARSIDITSEAVLTPYRLFSWLTTPICGLNIMILIGYMSAALTMFGFVFWLFRRRSIAYFAGYAVAFVPYHQLKSGSHIFYIYNATFIGIVWAYMWYAQRPSYKRISLVAFLAALSMYMDGYFIMMTGILIGVLGISTLLKRSGEWPHKARDLLSSWMRQIGQNFKLHARYMAWFAACLVILLMPVLVYQHVHGANIHASLSSGRGDIEQDAKHYSGRPAEFLLPSYNSLLVPFRASYSAWRLRHQHGSNPSEDTLFVGYTVAILAVASAAVLLKRDRRRAKIKDGLTYYGLVVFLLMTAIGTAAFTLPPDVTLGGHIFHTPVYFLIHVTVYWRVFARLFLVVDPLIVLLAATGLYAITLKWSRKQRVLLVALCTVFLFAEYQLLPIRSVSNLQTSSPKTYQMLANDKAVRVIAEYPIQDLSYAVQVFSYQLVHHKQLLNAHDSVILQEPFLQSITGLADVQALGALKARGVQVIVTPRINVSQVRGLEVYYPEDKKDTRASYQIAGSVMPRSTVLTTTSGFSLAMADDAQLSHRIIRTSGTMQLLSVDKTQTPTGQYHASFVAITTNGAYRQLTLTINKQVVWKGTTGPDGVLVEFTLAGNDTVNLSASGPIDVVNMSAVPLP